MSRNDNLISQRNVAQGGAATPACGDQHDSLTNILNGTASWAIDTAAFRRPFLRTLESSTASVLRSHPANHEPSCVTELNQI